PSAQVQTSFGAPVSQPLALLTPSSAPVTSNPASPVQAASVQSTTPAQSPAPVTSSPTTTNPPTTTTNPPPTTTNPPPVQPTTSGRGNNGLAGLNPGRNGPAVGSNAGGNGRGQGQATR